MPKVCVIFIQTDRGVIIEKVVMDYFHRAYPKVHQAEGRPDFWVSWLSLGYDLRRRLKLP